MAGEIPISTIHEDTPAKTRTKLQLLAATFRHNGFVLRRYTGAIPPTEFRPETFTESRDRSRFGLRSEICPEPDKATCYKTVRYGYLAEVPTRLWKEPSYLLNNAVFLSQCNHPNIPKFKGCVLLPDGRPAVAMEYIPNTASHHGYDDFRNRPDSFKLSAIQQLTGVAQALDYIIGRGGGISDLKGNIAYQTTVDGAKVVKTWLIDFDEGGIPPNMPSPQSTYDKNFCFEVTDLLREMRVAPRQGDNGFFQNRLTVYLHKCGFVYAPDGDWIPPRTNQEFIKRLLPLVQIPYVEEKAKKEPKKHLVTQNAAELTGPPEDLI